MNDQAKPRDLGLLAVAVLSIASSAVLARWASAPALALAFWRTLGGAILLGPAAWRSSVRPGRRHWPGLLLAGIALAVHFAAWLASLDFTSVAASVTLTATAPVFVMAWLRVRGSRPTPMSWLALGATVVGAMAITGGDALGQAHLLRGDLLAVMGAAAMAGYLLAGDRLRASLPTVAYAAPTYAVAALGLLTASVVMGTPLVGFDAATWLAIGLMTLGPQLGGHTVLNALLPRLGSVAVSLSLLTEPIGAALLAWLLLGEAVPGTVWVGAPLVLGGLALHIARGRWPTGAGSRPTA